jgi:class 3 adenylate cyclase
MNIWLVDGCVEEGMLDEAAPGLRFPASPVGLSAEAVLPFVHREPRALFGAPIAHEDHAQRACYAALHLQQELQRYADEIRLEHGLGFSVRMGLNSGEVVVGKIGDDLL